MAGSGREEALVALLNSRAYANLPDKLDVPGLAEEVLRPFGGVSAGPGDSAAAYRARNATG